MKGPGLPRIWADTIDTHRRQVTDAILDATAELITEQGPMSTAMAAIAERAGIGRATLYKYFPDVASILVAWHQRHFTGHIRHITALTDREDLTLADVAEFVRRQRRRQSQERADELIGTLAHSVAGFSQRMEDVVHKEALAALTKVVTRLSEAGVARNDIKPAVLAEWLFHAVHAPTELDDHAVAKLVVDSLAPPHRVRS